MLPLLSSVTRDVRRLSRLVKIVSVSGGIFYLAWGFSDVYLSIITHRVVGENLAIVGAITAGFYLLGVVMTLPALEADKDFSMRNILVWGKYCYLLAILAYFFAAIQMSVVLLLLGYCINGLANPFVHNTYETAVREYGNKKVASRVFGWYAFTTGFGWSVGLLIAALVVVPLLGIEATLLLTLTAVALTIPFDLKLPRIKIDLKRATKRLLSLRRTFFSPVEHLRRSPPTKIFVLMMLFFWSLLDYMTYIFVPLFAMSLGLSLTQAGLLALTVRLPYLFSFFFSELADRWERFELLGLSFFGISALLFCLLFTRNALAVLAVMMALSTFLAIIKPTASGILTTLVTHEGRMEVSGLQTLFLKMGGAIGVALFGALAQGAGFGIAYGIFGVLLLGVSFGCFWVRAHFHRYGVLDFFRSSKCLKWRTVS